MIKFATFNCNSIRKNVESVKELLRSNDIVFLQELMLLREDLGFLKELNKDFSCTACAKGVKDNEIATGRPSKGVAIFFRNTLLN